jgi:hypothetical protein
MTFVSAGGIQVTLRADNLLVWPVCALRLTSDPGSLEAEHNIRGHNRHGTVSSSPEALKSAPATCSIRAFPRCGIGWSADNSTDDPAFSTSLTRGEGRFCFLRAMCADRTARSSGVISGGLARSVPAASDDEFIICRFYTYFSLHSQILRLDIRRVRPSKRAERIALACQSPVLQAMHGVVPRFFRHPPPLLMVGPCKALGSRCCCINAAEPLTIAERRRIPSSTLSGWLVDLFSVTERDCKMFI